MIKHKVYISEKQLAKRIAELGTEINKDYANKDNLYFVVVLKGSIMFATDLARHLDPKLNTNMHFIRAKSYNEGARVSNNNVVSDLFTLAHEDVEGKNILIIEDIVDTGNTYCKLMNDFKNLKAKSVKMATLLFKPARLEHEVDLDYIGFEIEDKFVIGYGLDLDETCRELPYIAIVE